MNQEGIPVANEQQPVAAVAPAQVQPAQGGGSAPAQVADTRPVPSIGRVVQYRLAQGTNIGAYRPALIVRVFDADEGAAGATPESMVQLQVFTDQNNDGLPALVWATLVHLGEGNGEYRWPPYVPTAPAPSFVLTGQAPAQAAPVQAQPAAKA